MACADIHRRLLNIYGDQRVMFVFQQWQQQQWVTSAGVGLYEHGMQALVHCWRKCITNGGVYVEEECFVAENLLYQIVLLCFLCPL